MKKTIFNDVIKNEIKDAESNFPLKRNNFFNRTRSRMPAYNNNYYIDKTNAQNAFRSGFNINPNKGWKQIGSLSCVGFGITANYIDKQKAFDYWASHKKWNVMERPRCKQNTTK
jgi:hypothetical protein